MKDFDAGYRKALEDVKAHCKVTHMDRDTPPDGKAELELLVDFINDLLGSKADAQECSDRLTSGG